MSLQYFAKEMSEVVVLALALMFISVTCNPAGDKALAATACIGIAIGTIAFKAVIAMGGDIGHLYHFLESQEEDTKGKKK